MVALGSLRESASKHFHGLFRDGIHAFPSWLATKQWKRAVFNEVPFSNWVTAACHPSSPTWRKVETLRSAYNTHLFPYINIFYQTYALCLYWRSTIALFPCAVRLWFCSRCLPALFAAHFAHNICLNCLLVLFDHFLCSCLSLPLFFVFFHACKERVLFVQSIWSEKSLSRFNIYTVNFVYELCPGICFCCHCMAAKYALEASEAGLLHIYQTSFLEVCFLGLLLPFIALLSYFLNVILSQAEYALLVSHFHSLHCSHLFETWYSHKQLYALSHIIWSQQSSIKGFIDADVSSYLPINGYIKSSNIHQISMKIIHSAVPDHTDHYREYKPSNGGAIILLTRL